MHPQNLVGQTLGHYRVLRSIGYGGTATVFLAEDLNLRREVALKVFWPGEGEAHEFLRRFAREAQVLAKLDHPNILPIYDYGEQGDTVYLVIPYLSGGSLRERLRESKILPPSEAVALAAQALDALQYAHDQGLIHRDIKPGNMLFKANGSLVLSDFGLVKVMQNDEQTPDKDDLTSTSKGIRGTPDYMAPEQILGKVSASSDIYAMGAVLYEMLCGKRLFYGENYVSILMQQLYEQPKPLRQHNPAIAPALEAVIMQTLSKEPAQRYQGANALREALIEVVAAPPTQQVDYSTEPEMAAYYKAHPSSPGNIMPAEQQVQGDSVPISSPTPQLYAQSTSGRSIEGQQSPYQFAAATTPQQALAQSFYHTASPPLVPQQSDQKIIPRQRKRGGVVFTLVSLLLLVVLLGTGGFLYTQKLLPFVPGLPGSTPTPDGGHTPVVKTSPVTSPVVTPSTPALATSCPSSTQPVRIAETPSTVTVPPNNVVYFENSGSRDAPGVAKIMRYDPQNQGTLPVMLANLPQIYIVNGTLSQDGQWMIFTVIVQGQYELRLIRLDGEWMQTLYCAPGQQPINGLQWSFDATQAIFNEGSSARPTTYLLDLYHGTIQPELVPQASFMYTPAFWLNSRDVYITASINRGIAPQNIYLLHTKNGANQHDGDLNQLYNGSLGCESFDTSYDVKSIFFSQCTGTLGDNGVGSGPSTIAQTPSQQYFNTPQTIYSTPNAITMVRSATAKTVVFLVENSGKDQTQNGLWKVNVDGTNAVQLDADASFGMHLCTFSQFSWSNFSRDGTMFVVSIYDSATNTNHFNFGKLDGSQAFAPLDFAQDESPGEVGWT